MGNFEELIRHRREAQKVALFLGAFLAPLPHHEVERFTKALLKDRMEKTGTTLADGTAEKGPAFDYWDENKRDIIAECGLHWRDTDTERLLEFPSEEVRAAAEKALWEDFDTPVKLFERLHAARLVFPLTTEGDDESGVQERLIQLAATVARKDRGGHGPRWLSEISQDLANELRAPFKELSEQHMALGLILEKVTQPLRDAFLGHISALAASLLNDGHTAAITEKFLDLLTENDSAIALEMLLRLRVSLGSDRFHKAMQKLLIKADEKTLGRAMQELVELAVVSSDRLLLHAGRIRDWLPGADIPFEDWEQAQKYCLAFPVPLLGEIIDTAGDSNTRGTALLPLGAASTDESPVPMLAQWLLHPHLEKAVSLVSGRNVDLARTLAVLVARLAEATSAAGGASAEAVKSLAQLLLKDRTPPQRLVMIQLWKLLADIARQESIDLTPAEIVAGRRAPIMARRQALMDLCRL